MHPVQIHQVDERDNNGELDRPPFRVYLHRSGAASTHGPTDTYDILGADLLQVIDWAQRQAGESLTYAVALVHDDPHAEALDPGSGRGLVWLVGMDGNDDVDEAGADRQRRMLLRRAEPVTIPAADRMPDGVPDPYNDGTRER